MSFASSRRRSSCSQIRITIHPLSLSRRFTLRSLALFPVILASQKDARVLGLVPCLGQPCQKQQSTNTALLL